MPSGEKYASLAITRQLNPREEAPIHGWLPTDDSDISRLIRREGGGEMGTIRRLVFVYGENKCILSISLVKMLV